MKNKTIIFLSLLIGIILSFLSGIRQPVQEYDYPGSFPVLSSDINTKVQNGREAIPPPAPVEGKENVSPAGHRSFCISPALSLIAGSAEIHLEAGSISEPKEISIEGLEAGNTPALDQGMVNVTGEHAGFRMLPHGEFEKDITVILPYDTALIPSGYSEREIYTYYYNENLKRWLMLKRDSVDTEHKLIVSKVNHFTDFINAILKTPDMPETQAYTPTSIKDLKAANPLEGLPLFQAPTANNNGTANMSYPIQIPAGRQGMQPNLALTYNSGGGNGWLGAGWDISIPAITVETRWGVPRYNPAKESEVYLYQGEQLVTKTAEGKHNPMPHRTNSWKNRNSNGVLQFYPRVEESFDSIVRHGTTPANYWWSVTDRHGITYYYGKLKGAEGFDPNSVLRDASGNIAHWALTETVDPSGNTVRYYYNVISDYNTAAGTGNAGTAIYLSRINYTGFENEEGKYNIEFTLQPSLRKDVQINGRYGFKEVTGRLLCNIQVWYEKEILSTYYFFTENSRASAWKTRLTDLVKIDDTYNTDNIHCGQSIESLPWGKIDAVRYNFSYYDYPSADKLFGSPVEQTLPNDNIKANFITSVFNTGEGKASALSATKGKSWSGGGTLALGLGANVCMTTVSLGGNFEFGASSNEGLLTLIDLDGDGLADKVFKENGKIYYRTQIAGDNGVIHFGNKVLVSGISDFLTDAGSNTDWGLQASAGLSLNGAWPKTKSTTSTYFSDVNGDGLPDLITNGSVYFNSLMGGKPTFTPFQILASPEPGNPAAPSTHVVTSADAPCGGIIFDGEVNDSIACRTELEYVALCKTTDAIYPLYVDSGFVIVQWPGCVGWEDNCTVRDVYRKRIVCEPVLVDPDIDAVRVWVAPYSGTITLRSSIRLLEDTSESRRQSRYANGVRYTAQFNQSRFEPHHHQLPHMQRNINFLNKTELFNGTIGKEDYGEHLDSVVSFTVSRNDVFFFRLQSGGSHAFDNVKWTQEIVYQDITGTDDFGKDKSRYHSGEDFVLHGKNYFQASENGVVSLRGTLTTGSLNRNAVLRIYRNNSVVHSYPLYGNDSYPVDRTFSVNQFDNIKITVTGTNGENTTWDNIHFFPRLTFTATFTVDGISVTDSLVYYPTMKMEMDVPGFISGLERQYQKLFGTLYRGWGQFGYNNNYTGGHITDLIDETKLSLPRYYVAQTESDVDTTEFYLDESIGDNMSEASLTSAVGSVYHPLSTETRWIEMIPDGKLRAWAGFGNVNYIRGDTMSNTRPKHFFPTDSGDGVEEIPEYDSPVPVSIDGTPVMSIRKQNESEKMENYSFSASIPVISSSMGASTSDGKNSILSDYMDLNGDRYPDILTTEKVQYTNPWGASG